jgi:hypothetical protein
MFCTFFASVYQSLFIVMGLLIYRVLLWLDLFIASQLIFAVIKKKDSLCSFVWVLLQSKKIEATVPAECVDRFSKILFESGVYMIVYFRVEENVSSCMSTFNQFRLLLNQSTIMFQSQSLAIPRHSLTLFTSQRIANYRNGASYLIGMFVFLC